MCVLFSAWAPRDAAHLTSALCIAIIQRVIDLLVERKNVNDLCSCLISPSKSFPPLKFFEAQMYKLQVLRLFNWYVSLDLTCWLYFDCSVQHCGLQNKVFLLVSIQLVDALDLAILTKLGWWNVSRRAMKTTDVSSRWELPRQNSTKIVAISESSAQHRARSSSGGWSVWRQ